MGKSSSKLKNRRSQSIAWSFRFAQLNKKSNVTMVPTYSNLAILAWLDILDLRQYEVLFTQYQEVGELVNFTESDIKQLGIRNSAHRARIVSSLVALREKQQKCTSKANSKRQRSLPYNQRHSFAAIGSQKAQTAAVPIYEALNVAAQKQSKSLGDLLEMESAGGINGGGGGIAGEEAIALKKSLEWELSLDSRDLRSHAWYHGAIPRQRAEEVVQTDGAFLVRDCTSQPGNYVLTCKSNGTILHFVINKLLVQPETVYERVQYQFEDDAYDTVPDLITFYVGSGKAISAASDARIKFPCNRMYPLSFYASRYGSGTPVSGGSSIVASPLNSPSLVSAGIRYNPYTQQGNYNSYRSPMSSPPRTKRETPPKLPSKKQRPSLTSGASIGESGKLSKDSLIQGNTNSELMNPTSIVERSFESKKFVTTEKCNSADGMIQNKGKTSIMTRSVEEKSTSADGVINHHHHHNHHSHNLSRSTGTGGDLTLHTAQKFNSLQRIASANPSHRFGALSAREFSEQSLTSTSIERNQSYSGNGDDDDRSNVPPSPPPKPNRINSIAYKCGDIILKDISNDNNGPMNRMVSYHASGSDSGNGSGDSAQSSATGDPLLDSCGGGSGSGGIGTQPQRSGVIIKNPRFIPNSASSATLRSVPDIDYHAAEDALIALNIPQIIYSSSFDLENFHTLLLPSIENKPLDNEALNTVRMMLSETGPRVLANHLTRVDIRLILSNIKSTTESEWKFDTMGIELITLSHGEQFRRDLIERTECLKLLVAVTILTCASDADRADTLNKWIQVAVDTKTALGNLFGFCAIMLGLCMPQIQKLESTWHMLRQKYTDSAFNFEAKLRPTLKNMNDCSNPQAPNTTVPHLLPYILLRDRGIEDILGISSPTTALITSCIIPWENSAADFGLTIMLSHLDSARNFSKNLSLYQRNAQIVMKDSSCRLDELLEDAFRTEFHIKFLWGSKGAASSSIERHTKMDQILTLMADKFCNNSGNNQISSAA